MAIESYNSKEELSNFKKGEVYAFYVHNTNLKFLKFAGEKIISEYSSKISNFIEENKIDINNSGKYLNMTRVIGVVVDKQKAIYNTDIDKITVMFKTKDNTYLLDEYATGYSDVLSNNKVDILPAAVLNSTLV